MTFFVMVHNMTVTKIGQWPAVVDLAEGSLRKYRGVLPAEDYRELVRAVGLASHGVGIGSFVYLRRIFERLIEDAHQSEKSGAQWDEAAYMRSRMDEKIEILKSKLPEFLVKQRALYGIISKGLHELSEKECLDAFPTVRAGIELVLDQKVFFKEQQKKLADAEARIQMLHQTLST